MKIKRMLCSAQCMKEGSSEEPPYFIKSANCPNMCMHGRVHDKGLDCCEATITSECKCREVSE